MDAETKEYFEDFKRHMDEHRQLARTSAASVQSAATRSQSCGPPYRAPKGLS